MSKGQRSKSQGHVMYQQQQRWIYIKIMSSSLNIILIVDKHCSNVCGDEFPMPQIDRQSK